MNNNLLPVILVLYGFFIIAAVIFMIKTETKPQPTTIVLNTPNPSIASKPTPTRYSKYPLHKSIIATVFWVGEEASEDNDNIPNDVSAWDMDWLENYGGVDDPNNREGFHPTGFTPKENPFYIALPYTDFTTKRQKANIALIPWFTSPFPPKQSVVKNRWVRIASGENECFAQWENAGPNEDDDTGYVFGSAAPKNTFGQKAGIDISPAVRDCLKVGGVSKVEWQFIDNEDVPDGPWKEIITTSGTNWRS